MPGVGRKTAARLLIELKSRLDLPDLSLQGAGEEDLDTLCTVPGVGRKTAARLLIELKSRLDLPDLSLQGAGVGGMGCGGRRGAGAVRRAPAIPGCGLHGRRGPRRGRR